MLLKHVVSVATFVPTDINAPFRTRGKSKRSVDGSGHYRQGFTLIELLIVVGIICVLLALIVPTMNVARETSRRTVCMSNLRTLVTAWVNYSRG